MPARAMGEMALIEVMLHGWDIARSFGQNLAVSPELGADVLRCVGETAELGRQMEVYGPAVEVADDASDFDEGARAGRS